MILIKKELNTSFDEKVKEGAQIIPMVQLIDEIYACKYALNTYSSTTDDYLKTRPIPSVLGDDNTRLKGENWNTLTQSDKEFIAGFYNPQLTEEINGFIMAGVMGRLMFRNIINHTRNQLGFWSVFEERYEKYYTDISSCTVKENYIVDKILIEGNGLSIECTIKINDEIIYDQIIGAEGADIDISRLCRAESTLNIECTLKNKVLLKYNDNSVIDGDNT